METNARTAALEALEKCRRDGAWSGAVIDNLIKNKLPERREAALASQLILGVLQNRTLCDFYIDSFLASKKLEPKVRDILRLGVYQLVFLDRIPARAAVNESVALCSACGYKRASGLVNAVLRRISDNICSLPPVPNVGTAEHLSIKYSHPLWLAELICRERGYDFTEEFFKANNTRAKLTIQVNTLKISPGEYCKMLDEQGLSYTCFEELSGCIELDGCTVTALPGFEEGLFYVQDAAARFAADIAWLKPGMKVLDACAAPGGKSFAAAICMGNKGRLISCDIHEKKLRLIRQGAERLGIDIIETSCNDARLKNTDFVDAFDAVICDVPCSGMGVIRKKPEIRLKDMQELAGLPDIQYAIISRLAEYVRLGGTLVYSTCTVLKNENEGIVERFLDNNGNFELSPFDIAGKPVDSGMHTFWPNTDGTDGFFAAKLIRKR